MFDLNKALAAWRRPFRYHRGFEKTDVDELERHLRDQVRFMVEQGMGEEGAFHQAVREMGGVVEAESEYQKVYFLRLKHNQTRLRELFFYGAMLKNYILIAYRNLLKNKTASFINLFGLSVAIGCGIVMYAYVDGNLNRNASHEHAENIFLVQHTLATEDGVQTWGNSPMPLGPRLAADIPQVTRAVRISDAGAQVEHKGAIFDEWVRFAEPGFFDMFSVPLRYGDVSTLEDPNALILSATAATKYFGEANPLGKALTLTFNDRVSQTFNIRGVAEPFPFQAGIQFNLLVNYNVLRQLGVDLDDWSGFTATFIHVDDPRSVPGIASQMGAYHTLQRAANVEHPVESFFLENLIDLPKNNRDVYQAIGGHVAWEPMVVLSIVALFLLALACFNYVNIALAAATRRLREIAVRKVVGSNKAQLILQFLTENVVLCVLALVVGTALAQWLLVPAFNVLSGGQFTIGLLERMDAWLFLGALLVLVGLISGLYPAFYVASLPPVTILRGEPTSGRKKWFMQGFLTFQFILAFLTMIASTMLVLNGQYQAEKDWGYNEAHTLVVEMPRGEAYDALRNVVLALPGVTHISGASNHVGRTTGHADVYVEGEPVTVVAFEVGPAYAETMGLRLKTGRFLEQGDAEQALVINEAFMVQQGWTDTEALGQQVRLDSTSYVVAGVLHDFHYTSFFRPIRPAFFRLAVEDEYRYLALRTQPGAAVQTAEAMEAAWAQLFPDQTFTLFFQDAVFDDFYRESLAITKIFVFAALMALLISCMGLFGLAAQHVASRMKEVSIRKVLGASVAHVTQLVNRRFLFLLVIAAVLASPLSYLAIGALLDSMYAYHLPVGPLPFLIAYTLVFLTALLTVSTQVYKIITANPVQVLRNE